MIKVTRGHDDEGIFVCLKVFLNDNPEELKTIMIREYFKVTYQWLANELADCRWHVDLPRELRGAPAEAERKIRFAYLAGCKLRTFLRIVDTTMYYAFVFPIYPYAKKYAYRGGKKWSAPIIAKIWERLVGLEQLHADGLIHLVPFLLIGSVTPSQAKVQFGKGLWKRLCANSYHRNLKLALFFWDNYLFIGGDTRRFMRSLSCLPSSLLCSEFGNSLFTLRSYTGDRTAGLQYAAKHLKGKWGKVAEIQRLVGTYNDTIRMGASTAQLNRLSPQQLVERHDALVARMNEGFRANNFRRARNPTTLPPEQVGEYPFQEELAGMSDLTIGDFTAVHISNTQMIREEGDAMRHCVATYNARCIDGSYAVFSIRREGKRHSTLGVRVTRPSLANGGRYAVDFDQHYMEGNKEVTDVDAKSLALGVIAHLQGKLRQKVPPAEVTFNIVHDELQIAL